VRRAFRLAAWLSTSSLLGIVPHVMEDVRFGQARNFHMTTVQFEWFSGVAIAATAVAALSCFSGSRPGAYGVMVIGTLWAVIGGVDHHQAFLPGAFRAGLSSRLWIWMLAGLQAAAAVVAAIAVGRSRATPRPA
jgi:hypothetical protein